MPGLTQAEIIKRAEKVREYHKLLPMGTERLHINRGRQLMNDLLKDVFGNPLIAQGKPFAGDWEMLFTQCGTDALIAAIEVQQQVVPQNAKDEQQRKVELILLKLAAQTAYQVKAMLLDTAADTMSMKKPGEISLDGIIRRLENELGKHPTPPQGQQPFTWQLVLEQQGVAGLRAWLDYEIKVAEYQLSLINAPEDKTDKINFDLHIAKNKINYLRKVLEVLPA